MTKAMRLATGFGALAAAIGLAAGGAISSGSGATPELRVEGSPQVVGRGAQEPGTVMSSNWAGYAIAAGSPAAPPARVTATFTSVTGTWKQPKVSCAEAPATYSGVWVGIGGFRRSADALEQIGTAAGCDKTGRPVYYAWYELVPAPAVTIKLKIAPGDTITTSVNVDGTSVLLQIKNRTRRTSFTRQLTTAAPDLSSAEWIVEAPSGCTAEGSCRTLPLANFGSVGFTKIAAIGNAHPGTVTDAAWTASQIHLVPDVPIQQDGALGSRSGAKTAAITPDGRSFTVTWQATSVPPP
jgi:Peptidase A4 family